MVPELASREHLRAIGPVVRQALADANQTYNSVDAIAVTQGPGLAGLGVFFGLQHLGYPEVDELRRVAAERDFHLGKRWEWIKGAPASFENPAPRM